MLLQKRRKAVEIINNEQGVSLKELVCVIEIVERIPVPVPVLSGNSAGQCDVFTRRQANEKSCLAVAPCQCYYVCTGEKMTENSFPGAKKCVDRITAAAAATQCDAILWLKIAKMHMQPTQTIASFRRQTFLSFFSFLQTKAGAGLQITAIVVYLLSLDLMRYCPPLTPPNRYFPAPFVLVVATNISF